ncbi:hypothetical protein [Streptomyces sp. NPDC001108]
MTLDIQRQATRRMRRLVVVLVLVVLVLVAALVVIAVTTGRPTDHDNSAPAPRPSASAPSPAPTLPEESGGYVAPEEYVKLPDGSAKAGGLPVRFPRTPEGAAAMAVASSRNAYSWDAGQIRHGILTYAASQYRADMADAAEDGAVGNREYAGVPPKGPVPEGATLNAWPIGVQWTAVDTGSVDVLVLMRVTHSPGTGKKISTDLVVTPGRAIWEAGDWKIEPTAPTDDLPDPVDLGTPGFNSGGWKAIQEGDRR